MTDAEFVAGVRALLAQLDAPPVSPVPPAVVIPSGGDVQAALDAGVPLIELDAGGVYGGIVIARPVVIRGNGAGLHGTGAPAIRVVPGTSDVDLSDLFCRATYTGAVVQIGHNDDSQTLAALAPSGIRLTRVFVPTHRGKRGFELNCRDTVLRDCEARDVFTTTGQDSSALGILNAPGTITVVGGVYQGGSEAVLVGGDTLKLTDVAAPTTLIFDGVEFSRPLAWRTDGVTRVVKNLFELKTGHHVVVRNCLMDGSWKDGQDGYAVLLTPTRGGSVLDVVFEWCHIQNVGGGINLTGYDPNWPTAAPRTTGIVFRECQFTISKAIFGGTGRLLLLTNGPGTVDLERVSAAHDGSSVIYQSGLPMERIRVVDSTFNAGVYGINIAGGANGSNWQAGVHELVVAGNTIRGAASAFKSRFPNNIYVS